MHRLIFLCSVCLGFLAGCGSIAAVAPGTGLIDAKAVVANPTAIKTRGSLEECNSGGGVLKAPGIGRKFLGSVQYGSNNCPKKYKVGIFDADGIECCWPQPPAGYEAAGMIWFDIGPPSVTFQGNGLTATISGGAFMPDVSYYLYIYDYYGNLLSSQEIGQPVKHSFSIPSPLQGGFTFDISNNYEIAMEFLYRPASRSSLP